MAGTRAIGIVRVSRVGKRKGERFVSPEIQRERIETACKQHGLRLTDSLEELDTSGGKPLTQRKALSKALAAVENGAADAVVFAYRDRADRSILAGAELCRRMDAAGALLIADGQIITHATHDGWRRATMESFMSEDQRRAIGEKMADVQARCVAEGKPPWSRVPLGYTRLDDGTLDPNPDEVPIVQCAFEMRAAGESIMRIRAMLKSHKIERSYRGVQVMLANPIYLGELRFGELVNKSACTPIIDRDLYNRVQRMVVPRGPQARSTRLLARLGVLRCGSCGSRLGTMKLPKQGDYPIYRCGSTNDCARHVTISAQIAEDVVVAAVRSALADVHGRASVAENVRGAESALETAQSAYDAAIRAFTGLEDETAARERLDELRQVRDDAQAQVDQLGDNRHALTISGGTDWDRLTFDERRDLIRATVESATIGPGRGASRITVALFGEDSPRSAV